MTQETRSFQAEVSRLLEIVAHSLYSEKEIFLRELISNASDACDRLRYAALTEPALAEGDTDYRVVLTPDKAARTLTIADNGIGMNREELIENLGTIARSGTAAFVSQLSGDARKDMSLIGQFGVGFYSAFMVAEQVEVRSRKAGDGRGLALGLRRQGRIHHRAAARGRARGARSSCICARARTNISTRPGCARSSAPIPTISACRSCSTTAARKRRSTPPRHCGPGPKPKSPTSSTRSSITMSATASTIRG